MKVIVYISILMSVLFCFGCKNPNNKADANTSDKVSPEDVTNPMSAEGNGDMEKLPVMEFDVKEYNFGTVIQGEKVAYSFVFTNTGKSNLIISDVKASCGCTLPKWTRKPIAPGEEGYIEVIFDSHGRHGEQSKTIQVFANTQPNYQQLRIHCDVVTP